jgi:hypothetical protein
VGEIKAIRGTGRVVIVHKGTGEAFYGAEGNPVYERDELYTLKGCRCRVVFKDKDVVTLGSETHLEIEKLEASLLQGKRNTLLRTLWGKAVFYAFRLFSYRESRFRVRTPMATIGVRGTKFGVEVGGGAGARSDLLDRMTASTDPRVAVGQGQDGEDYTRVFVFEGRVEVTSLVDGLARSVGQNEILRADQRGLGEAVLDPDATKTFFEEVTFGVESDPASSTPAPIGPGQGAEQLDRIDETKQRRIMEEIKIPHKHSEGGRYESGHGHSD